MIKAFLAFLFFFCMFFGLFKLSELKIPKKSRLAINMYLKYSALYAALSVAVLSLIVILF